MATFASAQMRVGGTVSAVAAPAQVAAPSSTIRVFDKDSGTSYAVVLFVAAIVLLYVFL